MAEELAFARKASGLVRGLSFWDVFGMGLAFITPIYSIWYIIEVGLKLYPGANLLITIVISIFTIGWASPLVWGILGGTMPRSGGEYIYNSRIINPAIAMGASFTQLCAVFYWNLFNASMFAAPSLAILGQYMGWKGLANFATGKAGSRYPLRDLRRGLLPHHHLRHAALPQALEMGRRRDARGRGDPRYRPHLHVQGELHQPLGRPGRQVPLAQLPRLRRRRRQVGRRTDAHPLGTGPTPSAPPRASS